MIGVVSATDDARHDGNTGGRYDVTCNPTVHAQGEVCRMDIEHTSVYNAAEYGTDDICVRETEGGIKPHV